jgi:transcriptional regulator with GAF, ATPase, and Fis domain/multidrug efflux pump subunit AcrA (membrane-fusion protein)
MTEFAAALLAERELAPRARIIARQVSELLPGAAVVVYLVEDQQAPAWRMRAFVGDVSPAHAELSLESGTLGAVAEQRELIQFQAADLARGDYAHLDVRQHVSALAYLPILIGDELLGCVEIVSFDTPVAEVVLQALAPLAECAAIGLATALAYEAERNAGLESITRLTQLYDIEKVFNATLEMTSLWSIICSKVQELTDATGVNLWMVDKEDLLLVQQAGTDPTREPGAREAETGGIVGEVSSNAEPMLLTGDDPRLVQRNEQAGDTPITSAMAAALMDGESLVGVLEVLSCNPALEFDDDELFTLVQVAGSAAQALHNASLLEAERKVEILATLVSVSQEIASTLNQDRVLEAIVNQPQRVIPYDRAAIALEERGSLRIKAISGTPQLNPSDPDVLRLEAILRWASGLEQQIHVTQHEDEIDDPRPETREKFRHYFEQSNSRAFYAVPLSDEEGRLGILSFESTDPDFLTEAHPEIIKVLASQATVALRNVSLYREVPFISVLEPLLEKKRKFMALGKRRRTISLVTAAAVILFLVLAPVPMRVDGEALVAPARTAYVRANFDGVVDRVFVREGDRVARGTVLVQMQDWEQRTELARAQAKFNSAMEEMGHALATNDSALAGRKRVDADYWRGEVERVRGKLEQTTLRAQIDGVVATPHPGDMSGKMLLAGAPIMELVDTSTVTVDVAVLERDVALIRTGADAGVKLESFPARTFRGKVVIVSPRGEVQGDARVYFARVEVPNSNGEIRAGMQGRSKISADWHPAGYVIFRGFGIWAWSRLWSWFGW